LAGEKNLAKLAGRNPTFGGRYLHVANNWREGDLLLAGDFATRTPWQKVIIWYGDTPAFVSPPSSSNFLRLKRASYNMILKYMNVYYMYQIYADLKLASLYSMGSGLRQDEELL
jgi:hypothetical protein